jgi:methyl-accepting chemotaxis protein
MVPKPKSKAKPSVQTQFVLEAIAEAEKKTEMCLEMMQDRIDSIYSKLEAQDAVQQQITSQMNLTAQAIAQSSEERLKMAQQMAATSDLLAKLAVDQQEESRDRNGEALGRAAEDDLMEAIWGPPTI